MKVLITGAAGFIGSQLAYRLWKEGAQLLLIDNFSYGKMDNLEFPDHSFGDEIIRMDIRDKEGIERLLKQGDVDYVYNIAGIAPLPDNQTNPQEAIEVNVGGLVNILENGRKYGIKKLVQASTNAIYENEVSFPTKEASFELPTLIYPNTKYCAERFCESYAKTYNMNITCLRFANVYGPHVDCLRKQPPFFAYMIRELHYGRVPTFYSNGEQRRDYVYVDDLIELAIAVQKSKGFDCINASSNTNYSVNEMYAIAQKLMGKTIPAKYAEESHFWDKYPELYQGAYPISSDILQHEVNKYSLCDNTEAKEKYQWEPKVTMEDGLMRCIQHETALLDALDGKAHND